MNSSYEALISTPTTGFFIGACFMVGLVSGGLALGFYRIYRVKTLLYFSVITLTTFGLLALANSDPRNIYDLRGHWLYARLSHLGAAFATYCLFRLIIETFTPLPASRFFPRQLFAGIAALAIFSRLLVVVFLGEGFILFSAFSTVIFLASVLGYSLLYRSSLRSTKLQQAACAVFTLVAVYPLCRIGLLPAAIEADVPFIVLSALALSSTVWLIRLVERAREIKDAAEVNGLKDLARALIQLRDLMNTPLQVIEFSVSTLHQGNGNHAAVLSKMTTALDRLREINTAIAKYEKHVDWEQKTDFISDQPSATVSDGP